jgi:hypothetical protein
MEKAEIFDMLSLDRYREQLQEIARLAHLLANTAPHKIPLIELSKMLHIEGIKVRDLTEVTATDKTLPLMSRLAIQEIHRRFATDV